VVAVGPDLDTAVARAALTEQQAQIAWLRRLATLAEAPLDRRPDPPGDAGSRDRLEPILAPRRTDSVGDLLP
jgi:ribulose-5-phosphate 4-epimerase/fuculose-1-phosphate aldolase